MVNEDFGVISNVNSMRIGNNHQGVGVVWLNIGLKAKARK